MADIQLADDGNTDVPLSVPLCDYRLLKKNIPCSLVVTT